MDSAQSRQINSLHTRKASLDADGFSQADSKNASPSGVKSLQERERQLAKDYADQLGVYEKANRPEDKDAQLRRQINAVQKNSDSNPLLTIKLLQKTLVPLSEISKDADRYFTSVTDAQRVSYLDILKDMVGDIDKLWVDVFCENAQLKRELDKLKESSSNTNAGAVDKLPQGSISSSVEAESKKASEAKEIEQLKVQLQQLKVEKLENEAALKEQIRGLEKEKHQIEVDKARFEAELRTSQKYAKPMNEVLKDLEPLIQRTIAASIAGSQRGGSWAGSQIGELPVPAVPVVAQINGKMEEKPKNNKRDVRNPAEDYDRLTLYLPPAAVPLVIVMSDAAFIEASASRLEAIITGQDKLESKAFQGLDREKVNKLVNFLREYQQIAVSLSPEQSQQLQPHFAQMIVKLCKGELTPTEVLDHLRDTKIEGNPFFNKIAPRLRKMIQDVGIDEREQQPTLSDAENIAKSKKIFAMLNATVGNILPHVSKHLLLNKYAEDLRAHVNPPKESSALNDAPVKNNRVKK